MELTRRQFFMLAGPVAVGSFGLVVGVDRLAAAGVRASSITPSGMSHEAIWAELMEGNRRFVAGSPLPGRPGAARRSPAIVLGCTDSRVMPATAFDTRVDDLFTVRTPGGVADRVALGSIEYAVQHLHATVIVILGHERCVLADAAGGPELLVRRTAEALVERSEVVRREVAAGRMVVVTALQRAEAGEVVRLA